MNAIDSAPKGPSLGAVAPGRRESPAFRGVPPGSFPWPDAAETRAVL